VTGIGVKPFVAGVTTMHTRLVPLVAVAVEVGASESVIAKQARTARTTPAAAPLPSNSATWWRFP
jgi:hypothetical protein